LSDLTPEERAILLSNKSYVLTQVYPNNDERLQEALEDAKTACILHPTWWRAHQRKGRAYFLLKKYNKAVKGKAGHTVEYDCQNELTVQHKAYDNGLLFAPTNLDMLEQRGEANGMAKRQARLEHMESTYQPNKSARDIAEVSHCARFNRS
jgi:hypothetical protein